VRAAFALALVATVASACDADTRASTADCQRQVRLEGHTYTSYGFTDHGGREFGTVEEAACEDVGEEARGSYFPADPNPVAAWSFTGYSIDQVLGVRFDADTFAVFVADDMARDEADRIFRELGESSTLPRSDAESQAAAGALAEKLVDEAPLPPGTRRVERSPAPVLDEPRITVSTTPNLIQLNSWWLSTTPLEEAKEFYLGLAPWGLVPSTTDGTSTELRAGTLWMLGFMGASAGGYEPPQLIVQLTETDGGTAIRVDANVSWRPARTSESFVAGATKVQVEVTMEGVEPSSTVVDDPDVITRLTRLVDELPGAAPPIWACPAIEVIAPHYEVTFETPTGAITLSQSEGCGRGSTFERDGRAVPPPVHMGDELKTALEELLPPPPAP
jgi:hypothetical protein